MSSTSTNATDWKLCCLCYSQKNEALVNPTEQGLATLDRDLNDSYSSMLCLPISK